MENMGAIILRSKFGFEWSVSTRKAIALARLSLRLVEVCALPPFVKDAKDGAPGPDLSWQLRLELVALQELGVYGVFEERGVAGDYR